jgi:hypothetical protein
MNVDWPREVRRRADGAGVVYELPVRPLGGLRWVGLGLIAFSLFCVWSPFNELVRMLARRLAGGEPAGDWVGGVFDALFTLFGLIPAALGWLIAFGRCRVEYRSRQLRVVERAGPLRWTRQVNAEGVRCLEVSFGVRVNNQSVTQGPWAELGTLLMFPESGKPRMLVLGYPRAWLAAIARELSVMLNPLSGTAASPAIPVKETPVPARGASPPAEWLELEQQPAGSRVRLEPRPDGLTVIVPPAGLWKGGKGLFVFAVIWCGFMTVFTTLMLATRAPWPMLLFATAFWAIGLSLLAMAVNMGRRRALLVVDAAELRIAQEGLFRIQRWGWRRDELAGMGVGPRGMEVNHRPSWNCRCSPGRARR